LWFGAFFVTLFVAWWDFYRKMRLRRFGDDTEYFGKKFDRFKHWNLGSAGVLSVFWFTLPLFFQFAHTPSRIALFAGANVLIGAFVIDVRRSWDDLKWQPGVVHDSTLTTALPATDAALSTADAGASDPTQD
jgi:hypothetical protein